MNFDNAYKKPLCRFSVEQENGVHQAFDCAEALYLAAEQERYRTLSRTEMAAFLDAAAALQTEEGLIPLVIDKNMPSDCRVDLQYHPSYAAAAAAIYAWQTMREIFDEARTAFFKNLLHGCTGRGLRDHGLDAGPGQRRNLILLAKADVKAFVEKTVIFAQSSRHWYGTPFRCSNATLQGQSRTTRRWWKWECGLCRLPQSWNRWWQLITARPIRSLSTGR